MIVLMIIIIKIRCAEFTQFISAIENLGTFKDTPAIPVKSWVCLRMTHNASLFIDICKTSLSKSCIPKTLLRGISGQYPA